ncbi:diacylglycerol kinase family protein [Altererythrobacter salegens]|uniref:Diacylglycerol kinase family protein n=2 Tax=Croceibacterium salegens TaxID=1737568 RepID=A0A6I4SXZ3_9SPHN|nr:diacylglycerol kinase family protein [Croceibacterium salegens]
MERNWQSGARERWDSFCYASAGLRYMLATEANARVHGAATVATIASGLLLQIGRNDWLLIVVAIGWVWTAEAINTALERLADRITRDEDEQIKVIKDVAAGAVLSSSIGAALIGCLVFVPHLLPLGTQ